MRKWVYFLITLLAIFSLSCSTTTHFSSQSPVDVYVDGQFIGRTPNASVSLSDAVWGSPSCYYIDANGQQGGCSIEREAKIGAIIGGIFLWPIWLWSYGPKAQQTIHTITTNVDSFVQNVAQQPQNVAQQPQNVDQQPSENVQPKTNPMPQGYLDQNGQVYYIDANGESYYLDPNGNPYYIDANGKPYYK